MKIHLDTVVRIHLTNTLIYFGNCLLNIVVFKNAVNVTISNFTNLIAMLQLHMD